MNWYKKYIYAQGANQYLSSLGANPEVIEYILSQGENSQFLINEFRKNPMMTREQLEKFQLPQKENLAFPLPLERTLARNFELELPQFSKWILVNMRRLRKGLYNEDDLGRISYPINHPNLTQNDNDRYTMLREKISEIRDWVGNTNLDIASYSPEQAIQASDEWHQMMAGQGEGKNYEPTKPDLIMYGPEWQNPEWQGWTIQKVISENDLLAEGNRMDNCVGSYCRPVQDKSIIIYSLRDPANNPKAIIETDGSGEIVEQIKGHSNHIPDNNYREMIREWVTSAGNSPTQMKLENKYIWEIEGDLNTISWKLDDLQKGYIENIEDDNDYELTMAGDYGLDTPDPPEFTNWVNNFDVDKLMRIIFEQIIWEYSTEQPEKINWHSTSIIEKLISTVRHFDEEQDTDYHTKLLVSILKEQLGHSPTISFDNKNEEQIQKDFAQTVLNKLYEPKEQMEFNFSSKKNWYKKSQQLNNPEFYYLDNFLIMDAEKLATGANVHLLRNLVSVYQTSTIHLNNKNRT